MNDDIKKADTSVEILDLLARRWSPRAFSATPVSRQSLNRMLEAARWAPSSANEQPWRLIAGIKGEGDSWEKLFSILDDGNQLWCKNVPVLLLAVAARNFHRHDRPNKHYGHDVGQAMAHMSIQAMSENIYVHMMAGFYEDKAIETFGIPDGYQPFTCMAIGYMGDPATLDERNQKREMLPRERKPLNEIAFEGKWENAFTFGK